MKSFESRLTIFLSYSFIQRARAGALVLVSLQGSTFQEEDFTENAKKVMEKRQYCQCRQPQGILLPGLLKDPAEDHQLPRPPNKGPLPQGAARKVPSPQPGDDERKQREHVCVPRVRGGDEARPPDGVPRGPAREGGGVPAGRARQGGLPGLQEERGGVGGKRSLVQSPVCLRPLHTFRVSQHMVFQELTRALGGKRRSPKECPYCGKSSHTLSKRIVHYGVAHGKFLDFVLNKNTRERVAKRCFLQVATDRHHLKFENFFEEQSMTLYQVS